MKVSQIQTVLQTGCAAGMITMESSLKALCDRGLITEGDTMRCVIDPQEMGRRLSRRRH